MKSKDIIKRLEEIIMSDKNPKSTNDHIKHLIKDLNINYHKNKDRRESLEKQAW